jgi:DNA-binding response OmpR family regulator
METTTGPNNAPQPITSIRRRQRSSVSGRRAQTLIGLAERDIVQADPDLSVLLVIDDVRLLWRTALNLSGRGYGVCAISQVEEAPLRVRLDWAPDVILLDVSRPTVEVAAVCRALRSTFAVPVIAAVDSGNERLLGRDCTPHSLCRPYTADDVVRCITVATNHGAIKDDVLVAGGLMLSLWSRQAALEGVPLGLTDDEFVVLWRLVSGAGAAISRAELRDALSGLSPDFDERIVDWYVVRLMVKLEESSSLRLVRTGQYDGYAVHIGQHHDAPAPVVAIR